MSIETLRAVPLFAGLSEGTLRTVLATAVPFDAPAGQVLIEAGHAGAGLFVIEQGIVLVEAGTKKIELGAGEFFGELALLTETPHAARVLTTSPVNGIAIARRDFRPMLLADPTIAISMLEVVAARLSAAMR